MLGLVHPTHLRVFPILLLHLACTCTCTPTPTTHQLLRGFLAVPDSSVSSFQSILADVTGNFSLGFLRVNRTQLTLAVLHAPSSQTFWVADKYNLAEWSDSTQLFFNGSLVISDPHSGLFWSTRTDGDRVVLLNTSNLRVEKDGNAPTVLWQSFHFPTNTLVEEQNFTADMSLESSNGLYSMRLGQDFIGLYAKFKEDKNERQIYWRHKAMEAKAQIVPGRGPIYARVNSDGYIGMYQTSQTPVDVQPFSSFNRPINKSLFLIVRLEADGNLRGYYWDGSNWVSNYEAINEPCQLPSPCGSYGLCQPGNGCSCLDKGTEFKNGGCFAAGAGEDPGGDLCGDWIEIAVNNRYRAIRREGVELPYNELMGYVEAATAEDCERICENNCSCWGSVYSNGSGFCYLVDYPIQTLVGIDDVSRMGYFKVREGGSDKKEQVGVGVGVAAGLVGGALATGFGIYGVWRRRKGRREVKGETGENGVSAGPYKGLASASFRSIEMSNNI